MAKKEKKTKKGAPAWMATFSDLVTLVLVFFVLLFSMSKVDAVKFRELQVVLSGVGIGEKGFLTDDEVQSINLTEKQLDSETIQEIAEKREKEKEKLDDLYEKIKKYVHDKGLEEKIDVVRKEEGVSVVITDSVFFDTGSAEVKTEAKEIINSLTDFFKEVDNEIQIEGHTDNRPISSFQYPSNWELSGARASSIIRFLIANYDFDPKRFISIGYGETRPIAPNDTFENMDKNRRVVILIKDNILSFDEKNEKQEKLEEKVVDLEETKKEIEPLPIN